MATYVYRRNHRSDPRTTEPSDVQGPFWSLWRSKLPPAGVLAAGDRVVLLDHWRDDDRLSWELEVDRAEHHRYGTKDEAIRVIAAAFGLDEADVADDAYISAKGDGPGVLLAWSGRAVRRLDLPRPAGLTVGRHGWVLVDEGSALQWWELDATLGGDADELRGEDTADPQHTVDDEPASEGWPGAGDQLDDDDTSRAEIAGISGDDTVSTETASEETPSEDTVSKATVSPESTEQTGSREKGNDRRGSEAHEPSSDVRSSRNGSSAVAGAPEECTSASPDPGGDEDDDRSLTADESTAAIRPPAAVTGTIDLRTWFR